MMYLLWVSRASGGEVKVKILVEQFRADVGEGRPGDQDRRDEGEDAESGNDENQVRTFYGIHKAALSFHDVLLFVSSS